MPNKIMLDLNTKLHLTILREAMESWADMENDMLLDDVPSSLAEIRQLASQSDECIRTAMANVRKLTNARVDRLLAVRDLLTQL